MDVLLEDLLCIDENRSQYRQDIRRIPLDYTSFGYIVVSRSLLQQLWNKMERTGPLASIDLRLTTTTTTITTTITTTTTTTITTTTTNVDRVLYYHVCVVMHIK